MSKEKLFSFNTPDFPNYNLEVVNFKGYQEIGELFHYEIDLISKESDIDFDKILQSEVSLQIHEKNGEDIFIHGVLEYFEAHQQIDDFIHYKTSLVPKLWWLTLAQHQEIFLDQKVPDIIESVLEEAKFTSNDYEFRMQGSYDTREYVCQYKESRYDFIKRWMHRDGIYFYFESDKNSTKLIITDSKDTHKKSSQEIVYKPASGLQDYENQAASSIIYRSNNSLKSVHMRNYNYEKPSLEINTSTDTPYEAYKETYLFGNNLKSQDEAKKLSEIQAQKYKALDKEIVGESNIRSLSVGNIFALKEYFKKDLNGKYLMVRVESEGSQRGFLTTAFRDGSDESSNYSNTFTMIPAIVQFRMQNTSPWPHISGVISATIDGQGSGDTAELDKHGRYKVIMPFDLSGRGDAKASAYLRMAQPSAGEKQGMHFPLHKGTEVLIAFKNGDPDQPIITGAVPNINSPSPVNEDNVTKSVIQTHGGNIIHMEDTPGKAHIKMAVHDDLSSITIHNQDDGKMFYGLMDNPGEDEVFGIKFKTKGNSSTFTGGNALSVTGGTKEDIVGGIAAKVRLGGIIELIAALGLKIATKGVKSITLFDKKVSEEVEETGERKTETYMLKTSHIDDMNTYAGSIFVFAEKIDLIANDTDIEVEKLDLKALDTDIDVEKLDLKALDTDIEVEKLNLEALDTDIKVGDLYLESANMDIKTADFTIESANMDIKTADFTIESDVVLIDTKSFMSNAKLVVFS